MQEQGLTIDFDANLLVSSNEYEKMPRLLMLSYEALHIMAKSFFRSKLPELANLLIVGAGGGMETDGLQLKTELV